MTKNFQYERLKKNWLEKKKGTTKAGKWWVIPEKTYSPIGEVENPSVMSIIRMQLSAVNRTGFSDVAQSTSSTRTISRGEFRVERTFFYRIQKKQSASRSHLRYNNWGTTVAKDDTCLPVPDPKLWHHQNVRSTDGNCPCLVQSEDDG